ncbi:hypothetical protein QYE76_019372 [Lolium multiflorum]|uniref:Retrotransposon gag domain-containing protein n=1 Tax=Lolium multiflorum TaxID=4521 RepID=A0AAD8R4E1_LOLMU|nr:hypothetical protein QYE76_019372 [Lolium multiflorum]
MDMTFGSVHFRVDSVGVLRLPDPIAPGKARTTTSSTATSAASSPITVDPSAVSSMSTPTSSSSSSSRCTMSSMTVGSDDSRSSDLMSYYCLNCDTRLDLGSDASPFICSAKYSSDKGSIDNVIPIAATRAAHHQICVIINPQTGVEISEGECTPCANRERRRDAEASGSNVDSTHTITREEWEAARKTVVNNTRLPIGVSVGTLNAYHVIMEKNQVRLANEQADLDRRRQVADLSTGMFRPKTVEGATANLAAYLINNQPTADNPMAPAHQGALESLAILGDKLTPRKEKTTHHGSGSKHRSSSKDARDDITQNKIDKARRRCIAHVGFDSDDSEETQEHDGELRGADCLSHKRFKPTPTDAAKYDGQQEPRSWIDNYLQTVILHEGNQVAAMQCLQLYLKDSARAWLRSLPKGSIRSWEDLVDAFVKNFQATYKRPVGIEELRQCHQKHISGSSLNF